MRSFFWIWLLLMIPTTLMSQNYLLPSIGLNEIPGDSESVCYIPMFTGSFYTSGIQEGDTAADFKLYNLNGDSLVLSAILNSGKPVLLIAGSYTCPVFRNKVSSINNIVNLYGSQVEIAVIYTIEAHPDIDTSVYFGYVHTGSQNINEGILFRQPVTYGERKSVVTEMLNDISILAPIYIDGPCNNWWNYYGPAPNNAYLIDTNGIVFSKHGWYDKFPDDIICDIDSLLGNTVSCTPGSANGSFTFNLLSNDTITGVPGSIITLTGELENSSSQDVIVDVYRIINNLPSAWESSLCIDVCYPTTTDSATIYLPASTTIPFYFYIYTDATIDTARTRVGFRNSNNPNNDFAKNLFGITATATSTDVDESQNAIVEIFPNPAEIYSKPVAKISTKKTYHFRTAVYSLSGNLINNLYHGRLGPGTFSLDILNKKVSPGAYLVRIFLNDSPVYDRKLFIVE